MNSTDFHVHIEVLKDGTWHHYANPAMPRNDVLFKLFAGIESYKGKYPVEIKRVLDESRFRLPDDISIVTAIAYREDNHSCHNLHHEGFATKDDLIKMQHVLNTTTSNAERALKDFAISSFGAGEIATNIIAEFNPKVDLEEDIFHTYICGNEIAAHTGFNDVRVVFWFDN